MVNEEDKFYILELEDRIRTSDQTIAKLKDLLSSGKHGEGKDKGLMGVNPLLL
jgi:hypothetical protein